MAESPESPYRVIYSGRIRQRVRTLGAEALRLGVGQEFVDALKVVTQKLASEPVEWGDPQYHLHVMGLLNCHRLYSIFHISYAVDEERRIVYLKGIEPRSGHSLAD